MFREAIRSKHQRKKRKPLVGRQLRRARSVEALEARLLLTVNEITATKQDTLLVDNNSNNVANPGDTLRYTVEINNNTDQDLQDVEFADTLDPNTTLVAGSINVSPLAFDEGWGLMGYFLGQDGGAAGRRGAMTND